MRIRSYKPEDSALLAKVIHEAVHAVGKKDYNLAQIDAWSPEPVPSDKFHARVSDGRSVFVAADRDDKPIAFIELELDGHIDCFYCHPNFAGRGVGKALYEQLESAALKAGLPRLYVEASEAARRFFLRAGFTVVRRRDIWRNNIQIHNYLMEKSLR